MNYKFAVPLEKYDMKSGSDTRNFKVKKTEDKVVLRFDEENQVFYARIYNPSQHTRYLFQQGRLGISLCKLNCGGDTLRKHNCKNTYCEEKDKQVPSSFVKIHKHPRWSRCRLNLFKVEDLNEEIELYCDNTYEYQPEPLHSLHSEEWFNSIKAVLVSVPHGNDSSDWYSSYISCSSRAYKTMCNRIKIQYDATENKIIEKRKKSGSEVNHWNEYFNLSAHIVSQNEKEFVIQIDSMGSRVRQALNSGKLWIGYEYLECGDYALRGHSKKTIRYGSYDEDNPERSMKNRRYKRRRESKMVCPAGSKQIINSTTFSYILMNNLRLGSKSCLHKLLYKIKYSQKTVIRYPSLVIGLVEGGGPTNLNNCSMRLWSYQTNVEYVWHGRLPD